jgi:hypothetical protein
MLQAFDSLFELHLLLPVYRWLVHHLNVLGIVLSLVYQLVFLLDLHLSVLLLQLVLVDYFLVCLAAQLLGVEAVAL